MYVLRLDTFKKYLKFYIIYYKDVSALLIGKVNVPRVFFINL
ncbi:hypothetical protein [Borreliella valaisiana]|uniref:Uncharacterized protein n=1 Tax=Borreliella valaisiana VS116 TaxID=445987 RepID=D6RXF2_BORVA|nr:hypothetical protein [Borreliella valaisiana]EEF81665.1 hypothetical protein BVAVS116_0309 [Borreliella valaisiana VS116]